MQNLAEKYAEFLEQMLVWRDIEMQIIDSVDKELAGARHPLIRAILTDLRLEAEKQCRIQQIIMETISLGSDIQGSVGIDKLMGPLKSFLKERRKDIYDAEAVVEGDPFIKGDLRLYLLADMKKRGRLVDQFEEELKTLSLRKEKETNRSVEETDEIHVH